jgi:hypothetical protein
MSATNACLADCTNVKLFVALIGKAVRWRSDTCALAPATNLYRAAIISALRRVTRVHVIRATSRSGMAWHARAVRLVCAVHFSAAPLRRNANASASKHVPVVIRALTRVTTARVHLVSVRSPSSHQFISSYFFIRLMCCFVGVEQC